MTTHPLDQLFQTIASRAGADPSTSYTAKLLAGGPNACAKKVGEEAVEIAMAAVSEGKDAVARESADLLYHLAVLWAACGVTPDEVYAVLKQREGRSGLDEKASRASK